MPSRSPRIWIASEYTPLLMVLPLIVQRGIEMRFEYCCKDMKEMLEECATVDIDAGTVDVEGWEFRYCPFCGEKIEINVTVKE